ncbi:hypothetical protein NE237_015019 [Protea cynaroides]|uniref:Uncharacterized protein n=1 Tax=Protea cynaroides TaxID=273540 RepID=A0A9Q0KD30_9MAGN|nr:hypothetical protein NE237_015019 [Protea cynaroides]
MHTLRYYKDHTPCFSPVSMSSTVPFNFQSGIEIGPSARPSFKNPLIGAVSKSLFASKPSSPVETQAKISIDRATHLQQLELPLTFMLRIVQFIIYQAQIM